MMYLRKKNGRSRELFSQTASVMLNDFSLYELSEMIVRQLRSFMEKKTCFTVGSNSPLLIILNQCKSNHEAILYFIIDCC